MEILGVFYNWKKGEGIWGICHVLKLMGNGNGQR
jgi:hypothetical protein